MTDHTHQTAPTQFVDGAGIRFAYRRFGKNQGVPLVFFQHFTGTMDNWDPGVTDGLPRNREVILFNNAGISSSGGETPNTIAEMARHAAAFIDALGLEQIDLLGFSLGGLVAQQLTLDRPKHVRRLVLVGTGPRSGEGMATLSLKAKAIFGKTYAVPDWEVTRPIASLSINEPSGAKNFLTAMEPHGSVRNRLVFYSDGEQDFPSTAAATLHSGADGHTTVAQPDHHGAPYPHACG
jgi:pimeloyl-ACP methyl ester carboxylesterase